MEYYNDLITQKSFHILQNLRRQYEFILIGGWAVFLYTHSLKSKDIDLVIDYEILEKLRNNFTLTKNERLKKYEITIEEVDIDLYLPFYSHPGIPTEKIKHFTTSLEGFLVPKPEILLILKQKAFQERLKSPRAEKDKIDIISLLKLELNFKFYKRILKEYHLENYRTELKDLLGSLSQVPELELNQFQYSKLRKKVMEEL